MRHTALRERLHVDAAYGGFFALLAGTGLVDPAPWPWIRHCDSIAVDPHKHGLQPYGCGAVLFTDPTVGRFFSHDSPYTYFTSSDCTSGRSASSAPAPVRRRRHSGSRCACSR